MPIALTPNETWKYQLVCDRLTNADGTRNKDSKIDPAGTVWTLRALPSWLEAQLTDMISFEQKDGSQVLHPHRGAVLQLQIEHGVVGVENFRDAQGRDITLRKKTVNARDVVDTSFLDYLSHAHHVELANAIDQRTKVPVSDSD